MILSNRSNSSRESTGPLARWHKVFPLAPRFSPALLAQDSILCQYDAGSTRVVKSSSASSLVAVCTKPASM